MHNFDNNKRNILNKDDKSNKSSWDGQIISLCDKINQKENYFTTSSCSGRIVLLKDKEKKGKGMFLFRSHELVNFDDFKKELNKIAECRGEGIVYFKQEPCLVVVSCREKKNQVDILRMARESGFGKSGIISVDSKRIVEMISTENISFPIIAYKRVLVDDEFIRLVVEIANNNLKKGWEKIKKFEEVV